MDSKKLKELLLYVAKKDPGLGSIRLNKVLFFADIDHLFKHGSTITGLAYRKQEFGPTPRGLKVVLDEMQAEGLAENRVLEYPSWQRQYFQKTLVPHRDADISGFKTTEISVIDGVLEWIRPLNADEVSNASHKFLGYNLVDENEEIPLGAVFIDNVPLTLKEREYAKQLAPSIG